MKIISILILFVLSLSRLAHADKAIESLTATEQSQFREYIGASPSSENPKSRLWDLQKRIINGWQNAANRQIRIATFRDSTGTRFAEPFWYGKFGVGGKVAVAHDDSAGFVSIAAGATKSTANFTKWCGGEFWSLPAGGTITWNSNTFQTSHFEVYYLATSGGGSFKIQQEADGSGSWSDISGAVYTTSTGGSDTVIRATGQIESGFSKNYKIRALGTSGTCQVIAIGAYLSTSDGSRPKGVVSMDFGMGGTTMANWVSMTQTNFTTALQGFSPDLIFVRNWEPPGSWESDITTNFPTLVSRIRAALPTAAIIVVGTHPTNDSNDWKSAKYDHPQDVWMRSWCAANDVEFMDVRRWFPSRDEMVALGFMTSGDAVHLTESGNFHLDTLIRDRLPVIQGSPPYAWKPLGTAFPRPWLHGIQGVTTDTGQFTLGGFSTNQAAFLSLSASTGNWATNMSAIRTGIGRLKNQSGKLHEGRLGLYNEGSLSGILGTGRFWVGTGAASTEYGLDKNINAGLVVQAPATNVATSYIGAIASQTADMVEFRTGISASSDGTKVSGVRFDGIPFLPSFSTSARDALTSVPAGGVILNSSTGKLNFFNGSSWEAVNSSP